MPVSVETYAPAPAGMNRDLPAHAVDATFASYIVDGIVDQPNFLRERGPVTKLAAFPTIPNCIPFGIIPCVDLSGGVALCIIGFNPSTNVNSINLLSPTNYSTIASTYEINNVGRLITDYSACTQGGVLIGLSRAYDRYNTYYANRSHYVGWVLRNRILIMEYYYYIR